MADLSRYNLADMIKQAEAVADCYLIEYCKKFDTLADLIAATDDLLLANMAMTYAKDVLKMRWPDGEEFILKDAEIAGYYAETIIKDHWFQAESIIQHNSCAARFYATHTLKKRWLNAEQYIRRDPHHWEAYCAMFPDARDAA